MRRIFWRNEKFFGLFTRNCYFAADIDMMSRFQIHIFSRLRKQSHLLAAKLHTADAVRQGVFAGSKEKNNKRPAKGRFSLGGGMAGDHADRCVVDTPLFGGFPFGGGSVGLGVVHTLRKDDRG